MTSIAQHCRRRDSDSYSSYGSSLGSDDDDTESTYSDQTGTHSLPTNTSSIGSKGRYSSDSDSDTDISDSDSDGHSLEDSDDSDDEENVNDGDSDNTTTHSSNNLDTAAITKAQQSLSQGSGDSNTARSAEISTTERNTPTSTSKTNDALSIKNTHTALKGTNTTKTSNNGKELWWGDSREESVRSQQLLKKHDQSTAAKQSPPSAPPTRKETTPIELSYSQTRGKHPSDWKSPVRNRRLDLNQQQRGSDDSGRSRQPQQPSYKSDWRKQISASSDGMAASHWTMAGIDQHLLKTAKEEENWKKKKHEEKREVEWPSLSTDQGTSPVSTDASPHTQVNAPLSKPTPQRANNTTSPATTVSNTISDRKAIPGIISLQKNDNQPSPLQSSNQQQRHSNTTTPTPLKPNTPPQPITNPIANSPVTSPSTLSETEHSGSDFRPLAIKIPNQQMDSNIGWNAKIDSIHSDSGTMKTEDEAQHGKDNSQAIVKIPGGKASDKRPVTDSTQPHTPRPQDHGATRSVPISFENAVPSQASLPTRLQTDNASVIISLPHTSTHKTKHGYLQKRNSKLETELALTQTTKEDSLEADNRQNEISPTPTGLNQPPPVDTSTNELDQASPVDAPLTQSSQLTPVDTALDGLDQPSPLDAPLTQSSQLPPVNTALDGLDQPSSTPSPTALTLQEQLDQYYSEHQHPLGHAPEDIQWLRASWERPEYKEHDFWPQSKQDDDEEEDYFQAYYYIKPSMMSALTPSTGSQNETSSEQWMESARTMDEDDSSDYNRHQTTYTPSGFHGSSSQSFFGAAQTNTLFY